MPQNEWLAVRPKQPITGQQTFMDLLDKVWALYPQSRIVRPHTPNQILFVPGLPKLQTVNHRHLLPLHHFYYVVLWALVQAVDLAHRNLVYLIVCELVYASDVWARQNGEALGVLWMAE